MITKGKMATELGGILLQTFCHSLKSNHIFVLPDITNSPKEVFIIPPENDNKREKENTEENTFGTVGEGDSGVETKTLN